MELSLISPPVCRGFLCRGFLSGGPQRLRLSAAAAATVGGGGVLLWTLAWLLPELRATDATAALAATVSGLLVAALAARWLGCRLGALAGLLQLTSLFLLLPVRWGVAEMLLSNSLVVAMGAFALGNVPGRLP